MMMMAVEASAVRDDNHDKVNVAGDVDAAEAADAVVHSTEYEVVAFLSEEEANSSSNIINNNNNNNNNNQNNSNNKDVVSDVLYDDQSSFVLSQISSSAEEHHYHHHHHHRHYNPTRTTAQHYLSSSNNDTSDGAEGIVRAAARTVRNLRAAMIILIIAAAASCGVFIYKLASKNESDSFKYSFNEVATKLTQSFTSVMFENLSYAYILSVTLSSGVYADSDYMPSFPNVSINQFDTLTRAIRNPAIILDLIWSPLLFTRDERKAWEAYALDKLAASASNINSSSSSSSSSSSNNNNNTNNATANNSNGQYPPCYMCGKGYEMVNLKAAMTFPGVGSVTCANIQVGALSGYIGPDECAFYSPSVKPVCGCQKSSDEEVDSNSSNNNSNSSSNSFSANHNDTTSTTSIIQHPNGIFRLQEDGVAVLDHGPPPYSPVWQISPSINSRNVAMFNQMSQPWKRKALHNMMQRKTPVFTKTIDPQNHQRGEGDIYRLSRLLTAGNSATLFYPVFQTLDTTDLAGSLAVDLPWEQLFRSLLPQNANGITIVLENTLGQMYTYQVEHGGVLTFLGPDDYHDTTFDSMVVGTNYDDFNALLTINTPRNSLNRTLSDLPTCSYRIRVYPSKEFWSSHVTSKPAIYTVVVVLAFGVTSLVFFMYDVIVRRIQNRVVDSAKRSEEIVSSLFPALVRDRLMFGNNKGNNNSSNSNSNSNNHNNHFPQRFGFGMKGITLDHALVNHKVRLRSFLSHPPSIEMLSESEPIADLYPNTTVLFADIAGFTAWSSEREPSQVFKLLESLYSEFDEVARELGVFKVETIGDCYVAVTGLPEKMKYHAAVMVEFAFRCLVRMRELVSKLEMVLGPGTADLTIRVGLHSGPVTAGVLRGERARFQLFGDTMNVASRMESTGEPDRVHISRETAHLLIQSGKEHWVTRRQERVSVKGKGQMQTYWAKPLPFARPQSQQELLLPAGEDDGTAAMELGDVSIISRGYPLTPPPPLPPPLIAPPLRAFAFDNTMMMDASDPGVWGANMIDAAFVMSNNNKASALLSGRDRLVEWNADLLQGLLQKIVVKRSGAAAAAAAITAAANIKQRFTNKPILTESVITGSSNSTNVRFVDEITEVIEMPDFDERILGDPNSIDLGLAVRSQLRDYVACMAALYRDNPFHNFEHACHVAMSASKLLKRIITPEDVEYKAESGSGKKNKMKSHKAVSKEIHETTFGISSDPLMQFAVVFSALIHDVDHTGLTNKQLVQEQNVLAIQYQGKCVAEQRSIQVAWDTLMQNRFADLRRCIYQTVEEKQRFRQLLVNAVIATDIADKELSLWRKNRWDKVFHQQEPSIASLADTESNSTSSCDRKATIVFEYIIQASDVAHTMQHWHIYQKWNKRLFDERYAAFLAGREPDDPSASWHKGEIWFFDNYIIPLAKKLEECNVFGVSCDEYLTYALQNRHEWELKGEEIVRDMVASHQRQRNDNSNDEESNNRMASLSASRTIRRLRKDLSHGSAASLMLTESDEPKRESAGVA